MIKLLVFGYLVIGVIVALLHVNTFISESEKCRDNDEEFKRICDDSPVGILSRFHDLCYNRYLCGMCCMASYSNP